MESGEEMDIARLERALRRVGEILEAEGSDYAVTIIGGAALTLHGWIHRTTDDADILTMATASPPHTLFEAPDPLPAPLRAAIEIVARDLGLKREWLNRGPARQWKTGLPPGLAKRVVWKKYAGLQVGLAGRIDLIALKIFAEVDRGNLMGRGLDHSDLAQLNATDDELDWAAGWVKTQDQGPQFPGMVEQVVANVKRERK